MGQRKCQLVWHWYTTKLYRQWLYQASAPKKKAWILKKKWDTVHVSSSCRFKEHAWNYSHFIMSKEYIFGGSLWQVLESESSCLVHYWTEASSAPPLWGMGTSDWFRSWEPHAMHTINRNSSNVKCFDWIWLLPQIFNIYIYMIYSSINMWILCACTAWKYNYVVKSVYSIYFIII